MMSDPKNTQPKNTQPTTNPPAISIRDGTAHHAKYLLHLDEHDTAKLDHYLRRSSPPPFLFILNGDTTASPAPTTIIIYCFTDRELDRAKAYLADRGISIEKHEVEALPAPKNWSRTKGVTYESCEHVTAHIERGVEPDSMAIPRLQERVAAAEARAVEAEAKAVEAELKAEAAEAKIAELGELEARLQSLEEGARRQGDLNDTEKPDIAKEPEK